MTEGSRVRYNGRHNNVVGGIVAEVAISPLTHKTRIRVVDSHAERKDEEAGRWIDPQDIIPDQTPPNGV